MQLQAINSQESYPNPPKVSANRSCYSVNPLPGEPQTFISLDRKWVQK